MTKSRQQRRQEMRKGPKQKDNLWIYAVVAVVITIAIGIGVYFGTKPNEAELTAGTNETNQTVSADPSVIVYKDDEIPKENVKAQFTMENGESFTLELYPEFAPQTVANFTKLIKDGFYDGLTFHRVVDGFMAQGGDPEGTGMGGSNKTIKGEFSSNGFTKNTLSHERGVISMARSSAPDSASSQFFICYDDASFLDGNYAAFGKVIEGMEVVDGFLDIERMPNSMGEMASPIEPIVIKSATVIK